MMVECEKCKLRWIAKNLGGRNMCELCGKPAAAVTKTLEPDARTTLDKTLKRGPDTLEK